MHVYQEKHSMYAGNDVYPIVGVMASQLLSLDEL